MAFPSSTGSIQLTLDAGWANARGAAAAIKAQAQTMLNLIAGSSVNAQQLIAIPGYAAQWLTALNQIAALPGIAAYAQAQIGNSSFDVVGAFNTMIAAIQAVSSWITTNTPKDGSGNLLVLQFNADGSLKYSTFTSAQLSGLVTQLNALVAAID